MIDQEGYQGPVVKGKAPLLSETVTPTGRTSPKRFETIDVSSLFQ